MNLVPDNYARIKKILYLLLFWRRMNFASDKCIRFRNFFLLALCCFGASCNHAPKTVTDKKELDLLRQTDKLVILHRQKILPFVDSVYRTRKEKDHYLKYWRYRGYAQKYQRNGFYLNAQSGTPIQLLPLSISKT